MIKQVGWEKLVKEFKEVMKRGAGSPKNAEESDARIVDSINTQIKDLQVRLKSLEFKFKALSYTQSLENQQQALTDETLLKKLRKPKNKKPL